MVKFRKPLKIGDVIEVYENDRDVARALSCVIVEWDLKDVYTGEPIPLPEHDTAEWFEELSYDQYTELLKAWFECRTNALPKANGEQS